MYRILVYLLLILLGINCSTSESQGDNSINTHDNTPIKNKQNIDNIGGKEDSINKEYTEFIEDGMTIQRGKKKMGLKNGIWRRYNNDNKLETVLLYYQDSILFYLDTSDFRLTKKRIISSFSAAIPASWQELNDNKRVV
ncbi:MAG: hypothetical protein ACK5Z2_14885, partial [Bacteroidota bacterium]